MDNVHARDLAGRFRQDQVPFLTSRPTSPAIPLCVARVSQACLLKEQFTIPGPDQDVSFIAVPLIDEGPQSLVIDGRESRLRGRSKGGLYANNLQSTPQRDLSVPFDCVTILIPQTSLDQEDVLTGAPQRKTLRLPPLGTQDRVVSHLVSSLLPALESPEAASRLFVDHVLHAVQLHMLLTYGGVKMEPRKSSGRLAAWQVKRAQELMSAHISDEVSLEDLAKACQLSPSHFSRAFRNSVGATPHSWLTAQRIERAKALLGRTGLTLDSVALECGFANRVSFSRAFQRVAGASPARWRRLHRASRLRE